jgi:hypothetical protein
MDAPADDGKLGLAGPLAEAPAYDPSVQQLSLVRQVIDHQIIDVNGVRVENWPFRRLVLSRFANYYVNGASGLPASVVNDATSGFRAYRREVLETIGLETVASNGYFFQIEMAYRAWRLGFRLEEVPITFEEHYLTSSKISRAIEKGETRGFMKVVVDAETRRILGAAILGTGGDEAVHGVIDIMNAGVTYDVLQRAVPIHPTVSELIPTVLGELKPAAE